MANATDQIRTLCYCWLLTRADGTILGFTDHDQTIRIDDTDCMPQTGMTAGTMELESGFALNGGQAEAALSTDAISSDDILDGLYDRATVQLYLVNWRAPETAQLLRTMRIAKITQADGIFSAEMDGLLSGFDAPQGRHFRRNCDATFGDANCGINTALPAYRQSVTTMAGSHGLVIHIQPLETSASDYANGTFALSGELLSIVQIETNMTTWKIHLKTAPKAAISAEQKGNLIAGCDKSFSTCRARFNNAKNFRGFPHLPGNDAAYQFAKRNDVFDGSPIVP